jgi:hypothetical protein
MQERKRIRDRLSYSNVMVTILAVVVLGNGIADAAGHLGKNSVGTKQVKKNAITTAKIRKEAVTAAKVKKGTLTGTQINISTLGVVPTAQVANALAPAEGWHEVGAAGEPPFENSWKNASPAFQSAGFYKDQLGIVHLKGSVKGGTSTSVFHLPAGFRPTAGKFEVFDTPCNGCTGGVGPIVIAGGGIAVPGEDGRVSAAGGGSEVGLDGITFRAES